MIVQHVHEALIRKKMTLSIAESCTGGLISHLLTNFAGASQYLKVSLVVYSIEAKQQLLDMGSRLTEVNVVSEETAKNLAENVQKKFKTDYGLCITGYAGENDKHATEKPGTAFVGIFNGKQSYAKKIYSDKSRIENKEFFAEEALKFLFNCFLDD